MAADTTRARLDCLVFCAPYRNVGLFAKSAVTIDHVSGGRFELGMGSGWYEEEATAYGLVFPGAGGSATTSSSSNLVCSGPGFVAIG
jgi:alkanesulfonate monooxygenase SsuD/methylene tetrahydromethanopterin reductase-like flavin-dependent oxidoreductase (luciferase family)